MGAAVSWKPLSQRENGCPLHERVVGALDVLGVPQNHFAFAGDLPNLHRLSAIPHEATREDHSTTFVQYGAHGAEGFLGDPARGGQTRLHHRESMFAARPETHPPETEAGNYA